MVSFADFAGNLRTTLQCTNPKAVRLRIRDRCTNRCTNHLRMGQADSDCSQQVGKFALLSGEHNTVRTILRWVKQAGVSRTILGRTRTAASTSARTIGTVTRRLQTQGTGPDPPQAKCTSHATAPRIANGGTHQQPSMKAIRRTHSLTAILCHT